MVNKLRGYCISKALVEENLVVSSLHGTFALKRPIADDLPDDPNDFVGWKALKRLFVNLMEKRYGPDVLNLLLDDVLDWLGILGDPSHLDGFLAAYHAWMLSDEGRAWLSVRLVQLLSGELKEYVPTAGKISQIIFQSLYEMSLNLDDKHPSFSAVVKDIMKSWEQPGVFQEELESASGGRWVVMMNRHGYLHSHSNKLNALACRKKYTKMHVVGLLQHMLPLYLPTAQSQMKDQNVWNALNMDRYFEKTLIFSR